MRPQASRAWGVALLFLVACAPEPEEAPAPPPVIPLVASPPSLLRPPLPPLAWEQDHPERAAWSAHLVALFRAQLAAFDKAKDISSYCPRYFALDEQNKALALATLAVDIAFHESGYDPRAKVYLPRPLAAWAVGLFQLSYDDVMPWCDMNKNRRSLEDPLANMDCAVPKMAQLVAQDGVIAQGHDGATARGLARYWSVIREDSGHRRHRKQEIQDAVRGQPVCTWWVWLGERAPDQGQVPG